jgi:hypothetical protein
MIIYAFACRQNVTIMPTSNPGRAAYVRELAPFSWLRPGIRLAVGSDGTYTLVSLTKLQVGSDAVRWGVGFDER